jgi:hypothetical protein
LSSFLGLVNYYGKFPSKHTLTLVCIAPKQKKWSWGANKEEAFQAMKKMLQSSCVLVHFDPRLPLILSCDASPYGLGVGLSHKMPTVERICVSYTDSYRTKVLPVGQRISRICVRS